MSNDELAKAEEELLALTKAKADKIKVEMAECARIESEKAMELKIRAKVAEEINSKTPSGIVESGSLTKKPENKLGSFRNSFLKRHNYKPVEYGSVNWQTGYEFSDSDTGCDNDVSDWTPNEVFSDLIWSAFYCKGFLAGKVTVRGVDFARGKGDTVSIRIRGKRTAQGPLSPCECLSCVSSSFTKVQLKLDSYGDLAEICELDLQLAGDVVKDGILEDMASGLAEQLDVEIYSQLINAAGSHVHMKECCSGPSLDSCCMQLVNIYDAIVQLEAQMRESRYHPDFVILSPTVAAYFKYREAVNSKGLQISMNGNELSKIGTLSVIEFPCANACSTVTDYTIAVVIDSSRAVGEGWGMKPKMEQDRNIDCDSTTVAIHMYVGIDELDAGAIGFVKTPLRC
jgi:hypothetical protein